MASAARYGLEFVTLSDHNTVSGLPELDALTTPELLTMGGLELTTFYGHALALGRRSWLDWIHTPMTRDSLGALTKRDCLSSRIRAARVIPCVRGAAGSTRN